MEIIFICLWSPKAAKKVGREESKTEQKVTKLSH